jgi:hypothetical protein
MRENAAVAVAAVLAALSSAQAAVFDKFDDPLTGHLASILAPGAGPQYASSSKTGLTDVIGGARTVYVGTTKGDGRSKIAVGANISPDLFTIVNDSTTIDGFGGVIWDGGTAAGLNYDMSDCKVIRWDFDNDQDTVYSVTLWTYGSASWAEQVAVPAGTVGTTQVWLAAFAAKGVDLKDVDWVQIEADSASGGDVSIQMVECDIPEPALSGLAFAGLAGLAMAVRRVRQG